MLKVGKISYKASLRGCEMIHRITKQEETRGNRMKKYSAHSFHYLSLLLSDCSRLSRKADFIHWKQRNRDTLMSAFLSVRAQPGAGLAAIICASLLDETYALVLVSCSTLVTCSVFILSFPRCSHFPVGYLFPCLSLQLSADLNSSQNLSVTPACCVLHWFLILLSVYVSK